MKTRLIVLLALLITPSVFADRLVVDMDMYIGNRTSSTYEARSVGAVEYYNNSGDIDFNQELNVAHNISNETTGESQTGPPMNAGTPMGQYIATLEVNAAPMQCFRSSLQGVAGTFSQLKEAQFCTIQSCCPQPEPQPAPEPCTSGDPTLCSGGGGGGGGGGGQYKWTDECYYDTWYGSVCNSPLVVNLGFGNYRFSGASSPVHFDIDADGHTDLVTWTEGLSDIAFLALDRNGNGRFDNGGELFGNHTTKADGSIASDGFDALADLDSNGDGVIDSRDTVWPRLRLWLDQNHDGVTNPDEVLTPAAVGVTSFGLDHHWTGRRDQNGNMLRFKGEYVLDGHPKPYYDVYFRLLQ